LIEEDIGDFKYIESGKEVCGEWCKLDHSARYTNSNGESVRVNVFTFDGLVEQKVNRILNEDSPQISIVSISENTFIYTHKNYYESGIVWVDKNKQVVVSLQTNEEVNLLNFASSYLENYPSTLNLIVNYDTKGVNLKGYGSIRTDTYCYLDTGCTSQDADYYTKTNKIYSKVEFYSDSDVDMLRRNLESYAEANDFNKEGNYFEKHSGDNLIYMKLFNNVLVTSRITNPDFGSKYYMNFVYEYDRKFPLFYTGTFTKEGTISGTLIDSNTEEPISGARLVGGTNHPDPKEIITAENGYFEFDYHTPFVSGSSNELLTSTSFVFYEKGYGYSNMFLIDEDNGELKYQLTAPFGSEEVTDYSVTEGITFEMYPRRDISITTDDELRFSIYRKLNDNSEWSGGRGNGRFKKAHYLRTAVPLGYTIYVEFEDELGNKYTSTEFLVPTNLEIDELVYLDYLNGEFSWGTGVRKKEKYVREVPDAPTSN